LGHGVTAEWVGAPISGLSAEIAAGITYKIPTLAAVKNYIGGLCFGNTGGGTSITQYVSSFNGNTGAVTGASLGANTFTALNSFNAGISAAGGVTLSGTLSGATATFSRLVTGNGGFSGDVNISSTNATGDMYLVMSRGAGVTALFVDDATTPLVYQPYGGNLGVKGLTIGTGNDRLYLTPTQITATNTVTPNIASFYFVSPSIYFETGLTSALAAQQNRQLVWGDIYNYTENCYFGVNRADGGGMCGDYAVEINHSTGKALQLIYNDYSGAASNWVNMNVTSGGDLTITPSGGDATISGRLFADNIVNALNGFTGGVTLAAGTGISLSAATGSVTITNTGVQSFNGNTGAVTGASLGANTFTGLNSFNAGISSVGGTFSGDIVKFLSGLSASFVRIGSLESNGSNPVTLSENRLRFTVVALPSPFYTTLQADSNTSADRTITLPDASGTVALTSQLMGAVNGSTAATTAVTSFNGLTGAVTGVTVGGANTFTALNTFNAGISAAGGVTFANDISVNSLRIGQGPVSGYANTAIGEFALASLESGTNNTAIGSNALASATGGEGNVAIGNYSIGNGTNPGNYNVGIGDFALSQNNGGNSNIAIGDFSLGANTSGTDNVAIGSSALDGNETGSRNTAIGSSSLGSNSSLANSDNTGIGYASLLALNSGSRNTAIGSFAGRRRGSGGSSLASATGGIYIGYDARASAEAQTNEIVIGTLALGLGSNTAVIGATAQTSATIYGLVNAPSGISASGATLSSNTTIPSGATLTVNGNFVANGNVNLGDAVTDAITVTGVLAANGGLSAAGGTFSALTRFTAGISAAGGVTLAGTLQGTTANFTGTVTGTTFIGGLSGNATGIIINASSSSSELFPVLCTSTSSTVARADTVAPRVSIIPSTGQLTAPVFRVASTTSGGSFTEITDAGIITANSDLKLVCDGSILSLGDVNYITNGCKIVIDNSSGLIDVNAVGSPLTLTGSSVSVSGLLNATNGISAAGGTFSGNISAPNVEAASVYSSTTNLALFNMGII
jgi:hypothetical protein